MSRDSRDWSASCESCRFREASAGAGGGTSGRRRRWNGAKMSIIRGVGRVPTMVVPGWERQLPRSGRSSGVVGTRLLWARRCTLWSKEPCVGNGDTGSNGAGFGRGGRVAVEAPKGASMAVLGSDATVSVGPGEGEAEGLSATLALTSGDPGGRSGDPTGRVMVLDVTVGREPGG